MGYYHIEFYPFSKKLCPKVFPWGKCEYQKLKINLCNSPNIFQEKTNELFNGLDYVKTYIDDLLIISNKSSEDHIKKLGKIVSKLKSADFKVNADKSFFARNELECSCIKIPREGIFPLPDKVDAIKNIAVLTTKKQMQSFIWLINYYRDMWKHRSCIETPLLSMAFKQAKWN